RRFIFREGGPDFRPNEVPFGWIAVAVLVLAYAAKLLSERLERRWAGFAITTVYFEVLWVFFFSVAVFAPVRDVFAWVGRSRMWSAVEAWWRTVLDGLEPLRALWDGVVAPLLAFLPTIADTLFLPLAWFALAAIVIGRPLPDEVVRREFLTRHPRLDRMVGHSGRAWKAVPRPLQAVADEFLGDLVIRASSLANAFRAMRALGIERIAGFVLLWTVLALVEAALVLGVRELVGVQDTRFWGMFFNPLLIIAWVPTQVVRVALVAATYSAALRAEASASAASPGPRRGAGRPETLSGR
ncbi:MAG TPA: hypothetical protein GX743_11410, partial [Actinomycetales bacterium]|nr:hypothetical protein [Actinomycetales bacterium]